MFKKINAKERIVGFYSTGPKIKESDLQVRTVAHSNRLLLLHLPVNSPTHPPTFHEQIDELFRRFTSSPVFVIIDVRSGVEGIPVTAYRSKEELEGVSQSTHPPTHPPNP